MTWWIIATIGLTAAVLFKWWLGRPVYHEGLGRGDLVRFLRVLVDVFTDGSLVFIEGKAPSLSVQFAKYIEPDGRASLHFSYPDAPWSRSFFGRLQEALQNEGIEFTIGDTDVQPVTRFLDVDGISSPEEAARVASISLDVMGIDEDTPLRLHFKGAHDPTAAMRYLRAQKNT